MHTQTLAYIIILLALAVLPLYLRMRKWTSPLPWIIFMIGASAFVIRIFALPEIGSNLLIHSTNLYAAGAYFIYTIVAVIIVVGVKAKGKKLGKLNLKWWIIGGYLLFGLIQQLWFKFVFFDTLYYLLGDGFFMRESIAILVAAVYYSTFHGYATKTIKNFAMMAFFIDLGWGILYLVLGNLHWNVLSHAIIGGAFYSLVFEEQKDNMEEKFGSMQHVMEDVVEAKAKENVEKLKATVEEKLPPKVKELRDKVEVEVSPKIEELREAVNKKVSPKVKEFKHSIDDAVHRKHS